MVDAIIWIESAVLSGVALGAAAGVVAAVVGAGGPVGAGVELGCAKGDLLLAVFSWEIEIEGVRVSEGV